MLYTISHTLHVTLCMLHNTCHMLHGTYSVLACFVQLAQSALLQLVGPVLAQDSKPVTHELDSFLTQGLSEGHGLCLSQWEHLPE